MTLKNARTSVVRADGIRVKPVVKTFANASATKAQRLRAARVEKALGEAVSPKPKQQARQRTLTAARVVKLKQQKRTA